MHQLDCEESLESFFFQNLPPVPLECFNLKVSLSIWKYFSKYSQKAKDTRVWKISRRCSSGTSASQQCLHQEVSFNVHTLKRTRKRTYHCLTDACPSHMRFQEPELFKSHLLALIKCLPPSLEALEVRWHVNYYHITERNIAIQEALSENYSLTECTIGGEHYEQIVKRNRKLKEEARFKRGKVALGKSHEISREGSPPRKLVKYDWYVTVSVTYNGKIK